jgi:hypothetical protein
MRAVRVAVAACAIAIMLGVTSAGASNGLPAPGSPKQVAALVAASHKIDVLPRDLDPAFENVGDNTPARYYAVTKNGCTGVKQCVFGRLGSKTAVVLFGDSHAWMWLPALVNVASSDGFKLVLIWMPGCPAASLSVWNPDTHSVLTACNSFRSSSVALIKKLAPALVLLASRTTNMYGAHHELFSNAAWQAGLEKTIGALKTKATAVAVIGDITAFNVQLPECLATYPEHVQHCSVSNPNKEVDEHVAAERAAAKAEAVAYIDPQPWLCTKTCSPVIGSMAAYFDSLHVTAVYAAYLSIEFQVALKHLV